MKGEITLKLFCQSPIEHPNCEEVKTFTSGSGSLRSTRDQAELAELAGWRRVRLSSHDLTSLAPNSDSMIDHYNCYACPECIKLIDKYLRQDIPGNQKEA